MQTSYPEGAIKLGFQFGGREAGPAMVKTAAAFAHSVDVNTGACDLAAAYLRDLKVLAPFGCFDDRDLVKDRQAGLPMHVVAVTGDPETGILLSAVRDFLLLYVTDAASHLAYINKLNAMSDFGGIAQEAHIIVGTAGNIGAAQVSALARVLENACRNYDHATVTRLVGELNAANVVATDAIHDWLDGTASEMDNAAEASA